MNPETGLFTWTPAQNQAPSTNGITVRVRDDGVPPLEDSETISVIVALPPGFAGARRNGNALELVWQTRAGRTYRVEHTENLTAPAWEAVGSDLPATGDWLSITNTMNAQQEFFR